MALGRTVENQIIDDVVSALEGITTVGDAYNTDVVRVYTMYGNALELPERPSCVVLPMRSPRSHDCPNGVERVDLKLVIGLVMDLAPPESGDIAPWGDDIRHFANDVEKALQVDPDRGELALDTIIEDVDIFEAVQGMPVAAAEVSVTIPFRYTTADPTQAQ